MKQNNQNPDQGSLIDRTKLYSRDEIQRMEHPALLEYAQLLDKRLYLLNLELIQRDEKIIAMRKSDVVGSFKANYPENIKIEPDIVAAPSSDEPDPLKPKVS